MQILDPTLDLDRFFVALQRAVERVLLLDFDGTLAPLEPRRDQVRIYDGVEDILQRLLAGSCRVILVSGRAAGDLAAMWPGDPRPEIWGSHGAERLRPDGRLDTASIDAETWRAFEAERGRIRAHPQAAWFEIKPLGIALHLRGRPALQAQELTESIRARWAGLAESTGLRLRDFDGGIELHPDSADKGTAVSSVLDELDAGAVAAFLGDDETDEDAFRAMRGRGITVLVRPTLRPSAAQLWIQPPFELVQFLARWERAIASGEACG